jgi:GTPase SAR1 family protein
MPKLPDLASGFKTLREVDLNAIRSQAELPFHIVVIGGNMSGKSMLITQLLSGQGKIDTVPFRPISELQLNEELFVQPFSVIIMILDASQPEHLLERQLFDKLRSYRVPIIVCYNKIDLVQNSRLISNEALRWQGAEVVAVSAWDRNTMLQSLVPALLRVYRGQEVLLARHLPMLREPVSQKLIEDTCFINATYSLASGLAQINILFTLPLSVADMVVLTKNQAVMAYKISLACNLPSDWRETVPKLATVVGTAFLWRL